MEQASELFIHEINFPDPRKEKESFTEYVIQQILDEIAQEEQQRKNQMIHIVDPEGQKILRATWKNFLWLAKIFYGKVTMKIDVKNFTCCIQWETKNFSLRSSRAKLVMIDLLTSCESLKIEPGTEDQIRVSTFIPLFREFGFNIPNA